MKIFVALNFLAGFLHYLFLVVASRRLPVEDFSAVSAWLAYLSFALVGAAVLQYLSCFLPLRRYYVRWFVAAGWLYAVVVSLLPFSFPFDHWMIGALAGLMACAFGVFQGQAQGRMLFLFLGVGNLIVAAAKLLFALLPFMPAAERYFWAVPLSYVPGLFWLGGVLFLHVKEGQTPATQRAVGQALAATIILGAASALFPQYELMLMNATQTPQVFHSFARLSLFYKAIFFAFLIFSQWLLPHQLRDDGRTAQVLGDAKLYAGAIGLSAIAAALGPWVAQVILGWEEAPSRVQILLSCWNMALLTWIFLWLQELCARQKTRRAVGILLAVLALALAQLFVGFSVEVYYVTALMWNTGLLLWLSRPSHFRF